MNEQLHPIFSLEKIYVKDLSLEIPNAPTIFLERETPEINIQLGGKNQTIDDGLYEVLLTVTVTAKIKEKVMFLVEVQQAGIFRILNVPNEEIDPLLGIGCPNILFPYLREAVSDVVMRAGFPPVLMSPVNFESIYHQKKAETDKN
ncbi:protein-export chaperone SecB [Nitrosomonas sp. JL21]|uniref:protein-export chaperone SecB n=1 Tax=Nitrosomonas sp. JL21 TaxID=153949 RepID=UPI00136973B5|nr:protein-export chaperone SecB [Nitrosomonas sp. JL21]MBL8497574.1 protein-export chaperone SecB [Nitrosomonas sp.]MCC7090987.1 protein-export chaperone SecB [Nitrosomonas sp.]MXS77828.1 protein-export chaperone SecB [Nitrosomonas sp. JL21]